MNRKRVRKIILGVISRMKKPYYEGASAELGFFFLLSMVPLFTIFSELLGFFSISLDLIENWLSDYVSTDIAATLAQYFEYKPSGTISFFFILFALWAASKAQFSMIRIANYTYFGEDNSGRSFFRERVRAVVTIIVTILLMAFSLAILVYGEPIMKLAALYVDGILGLPFDMDQFWYLLRWPLGIAVYFLAITFINYSLPAKRMPVKKIIPGSVFASAGMLVVSWIYSYYASTFAAQNLLYGSLGSVVGLLIWFYILGSVLVVGIVLNAVWEETK